MTDEHQATAPSESDGTLPRQETVPVRPAGDTALAEASPVGEAVSVQEQEATVEEELIEEISIDGMCGVY